MCCALLMKRLKTAGLSLLPVLTLLAGGQIAHAQTQRSGGGEAQKFMQQYQQLAAEKTSLQVQVAQLKKDLDAAQTDLAAARKERDSLKVRASGSAGAAAQLAQVKVSRDVAEKNLDQYKQRTNELIDRFKETVGSLKGVEADRAQLRKDNDELHIAMDKCADNNMKLLDITNSVLDRYDRVGFFTKASAAEPFTRITRSRIENLVDESRARAEELRVKKRTP